MGMISKKIMSERNNVFEEEDARYLRELPFYPGMFYEGVYEYPEFVPLVRTPYDGGYMSTRQGHFRPLGFTSRESMLIGEDNSGQENEIEGWNNSLWTIAPWNEMIESEFIVQPGVQIPHTFLMPPDLNLLQRYGYRFGDRLYTPIDVHRQYPHGETRECWLRLPDHTKRLVCRKLSYANMNVHPFPHYRHRLMTTEKAVCLRLDHPNVIETYSVWTKYRSFADYRRGEAFTPQEFSNISFMLLFMERADGNLDAYLNNYHESDERVLNEYQARDWFTPVLSALEYIHSLSIAHLNIKARNVMFAPLPNSRSGIIKLRDFSCARIVTEQNAMTQTWRGDDERFQPPETGGNAQFDPFIADVYSLGKLLQCMLSANFRYEVIPYTQPQQPMTVQALITEGAFELITEMCSKNVQQRYTLEQVRLHPWVCQQNYPYFEMESYASRPWNYLPFWDIADPDIDDYDNTWWDNMEFRPEEY